MTSGCGNILTTVDAVAVYAGISRIGNTLRLRAGLYTADITILGASVIIAVAQSAFDSSAAILAVTVVLAIGVCPIMTSGCGNILTTVDAVAVYAGVSSIGNTLRLGAGLYTADLTILGASVIIAVDGIGCKQCNIGVLSHRKRHACSVGVTGSILPTGEGVNGATISRLEGIRAAVINGNLALVDLNGVNNAVDNPGNLVGGLNLVPLSEQNKILGSVGHNAIGIGHTSAVSSRVPCAEGSVVLGEEVGVQLLAAGKLRTWSSMLPSPPLALKETLTCLTHLL
jgi:uncharacterized protein YceK